MTWPFPTYRVNKRGELTMVRPRKPKPVLPAAPF